MRLEDHLVEPKPNATQILLELCSLLLSFHHSYVIHKVNDLVCF